MKEGLDYEQGKKELCGDYMAYRGVLGSEAYHLGSSISGVYDHGRLSALLALTSAAFLLLLAKFDRFKLLCE